MNLFIGLIIIVIGFFLFLWGMTKSENPIYQKIKKMTESLFKEYVHIFNSAIGFIILIVGLLYSLGIIFV